MNKINYQLPGIILWFTGLSGSGKTTVGNEILRMLQKQKISTRMIDGDEIRKTRNKHLGFSEADIKCNNNLIADLCAEQRNRYNVLLVPIISPYRQSRKDAKEKLSEQFYEIYFSASIDCVQQRDVKGLYEKSARKEINNLIGVAPTNPYEPPDNADLIINTEKETIQQSVECLYNFIIDCLNTRTLSHDKRII